MDRLGIEVGWQRDGEMQVGLVLVPLSSEEPQTLVEYLYADSAEVLGRALIEAYVENVDNFQAAFDTVKGCHGTPNPTTENAARMVGESMLRLFRSRDLPIRGDSIWAALARVEANDLIPLIRKARDGAYGKDQ